MELMGVIKPYVIDDDFLLENPTRKWLYVAFLLTEAIMENETLLPDLVLAYLKSHSGYDPEFLIGNAHESFRQRFIHWYYKKHPIGVHAQESYPWHLINSNISLVIKI